MRQYQRGAPSSCLHPLTTNFGPFLGPKWLTKTRNCTPVLESNWGLGLQIRVISCLSSQTPHGLSAPVALPFHH